MQPTELTSAKNSALREMSDLLEKPNVRKEKRRLVIEGERACCEAYRQGLSIRRWVWSSEAWGAPRLAGIRRALQGAEGMAVYTASGAALASATSLPTAPEMVAEVEWPAAAWSEVLKAAPASALFVVLDRIQDPGNVGTILRTAEALGATAAILTAGTADPYNPKAIRASALSVLRIPHARDANPAEVAEGLKKKRATIYIAMPDSGVSLLETKLSRPCAFVFGNEGGGVRESDWPGAIAITVPVAGRAESLNVAASAAVVLYEASRQAGEAPPIRGTKKKESSKPAP